MPPHRVRHCPAYLQELLSLLRVGLPSWFFFCSCHLVRLGTSPSGEGHSKVCWVVISASPPHLLFPSCLIPVGSSEQNTRGALLAMFTILPLALASRAGRGLWEPVSPGLVILLFSAACSAQTGRKASAALNLSFLWLHPVVRMGHPAHPPKESLLLLQFPSIYYPC